MRFGIALSGGGSRAAAFHCGTLRACVELGWVERVDVLSTVSGGSLFGGAWMAARARGESEAAFIDAMTAELARGFVLRSIGLRARKLLWPGTSRTDLIADTFDRVFFRGATLDALPARPALCLNVTVMNNAQVGKLSRDGFTTRGAPPSALPRFPLARAVAASAAFPVGLPPLRLNVGPRPVYLTDGGVLENLGVQTLLRSTRFGVWDLLVSDAGTHEAAWSPSAWAPLRSLVVSILSAGALERVMTVMNNKENRSMRSLLATEVEATWVAAVAKDATRREQLAEYVASAPATRRKLYFTRVDQTWAHFLAGIPRWRWIELGVEPSADVEAALAGAGIDVTAAKAMYAELGGDDRVEKLNQIKTNFTALPEDDIRDLARHARWQVHLAHGVYG